MRFYPARGLVLFIASAVAVCAAQLVERSPGAQRAFDQFREFYLGSVDAVAMRDTNEPPPDPRQSSSYAKSLSDDGHWPDLDYASNARSGWPPERHCSRMIAMAITAGLHETSAAERAHLLSATHRALGYWIAHDFQCPNWWYNEIGIPKSIGALCLLLGEDLTAEEFRYAKEVSLKRFPIGRTGQNKVWLAGNALMRGVLAGDDETIRVASDAIWSEVNLSTEEGIQPDFSFHQHGPQLQFGNYGMAFAVETARWCQILRETPWQLPPPKLAIFRNYLLEGQSWVSWRGAMDISSCGRQLMPHSPRSKTTTIARVMQQAELFDAKYRDRYEAYLTRNRPGAPNDLVGNRFFWRSDYIVHRRPEFAATLKLSSNRVIGAELVNRENLLGYHEADGALYLYREGNEYEDIFPVWDWCKIPGVTCALVSPPDYKTTAVPTDFVGGVSDSGDGVFALDYTRDGVRARKAWFFFGDTVVCLGSEISATGSAPIATTVNQCLWRGPIRIQQSGADEEMTQAGDRAIASPAAIEHDGWRITFLQPAQVRVTAGPVTGNWRRVFDNPETPAKDVTADVFTVWIDHGEKPQNAGYAYSVAPIESMTKSNAVQVLENSGVRQIVQTTTGKVGVIFWSAGETSVLGRKVAVSAPCVVLMTTDSVRVADPTQKLESIALTIDGRVHEVSLPQNGSRGSSGLVQ